MPTIEEIKAQLIQNPTYKNSLMAAPTGADYQVGLDKYNTYATPDPLYDKYLNQSNLQSFGNTLVRGVVKFALSIPENAGYMWDMANSHNDFDNGLSQWARNLKEDVDREFPEYSKYFEDGFNPGDADWWFRNGDSIIESVGYVIPGLALGKGVGTFVKVMGAAANTARIAGTVTATLASNYAEGMQMAGARYRQLLDSGVSKEDAAKAASNIVNWNRANLILQYAESSMLLRGIGGATSMSGIGVKASLKDVGKQFLMEGFEEWNQGFIEEENVRSAMIKSGKAVDDGKSLFDRVKDYAFSDDALTQAFIGGIGGAVMQGGNDAVLNLDPKYREQKKLAFEQIGKNYGQLINLAEIVSKKQDEKDGAVSDEIAFNHKTKEQALDVVMANVENGTYSQFMKTFDSVLSMTDEEAAAKGLNKTEMAKMSEVLKPAMERMAKAYSRVEAEFRGKLPQEYIKEVAKQSYYSLIHAESAKEYGKKIDKTHSEIPFKNVTLSSINKKSSEIAALHSIIEETKNSKSEAAVELHSAAVKLMTKLGNELSDEIDTAKSVYGDSYQESDWESPVYDSEIVADSKKKFEHEFISTFHNKEYKTYSSKTKVEELKKEAEEKNAAEELKQKQEAEAIFAPVRTAFKSASNIGEYLDESERTSAKATITSQFNSLKETEAYKKSSKTVQDKLEKEYLKALKTIESAKIKKVVDEEEEEGDEEDSPDTDFVPTEGTMSRKRYSNSIRKKDNILTAGYLGQAYETVTDDKGNVHYKDLVDEEGNPKIISHADERLNDYTFFKPGEEIEIVLDAKYAALAGIPINEENLYRIPFGIRKAGSPITMWVHKFDAPVGTEIDSNIKRLIQEPKLDANGVVVSNLQEQEQKRLLALRKYLWENTQNNNVVKAKINSRTTGYSIETEPRPAANQLMVDGKVAEDVDFAMVVSGVITPITSEYTVSTEGRRDENGKLIFPEGALLVTVPGFAVDRAGSPVLEPYFAQAHQLSDNDVDVIMNVITRGKPSDAWAGLGFEIPSFEAFLSNYVYNGKNSGKVLIDIEKDGVKRNRYIYTTSLLKGSWDKKSRIRVWTNETSNPVTEKELQAAREFLSTLYYNFPKATKEYPQYSVKDGNLVFEGKVGYKERIANNTNVTIQGKRVGNTQRMQFFTQAIMGYEIVGFGNEEKKSPLGKNPLGVKILPPKKKVAVAPVVTEVKKTSAPEISADPIASLFPIKSEILRVYKSNPGVSVFDLQGELPAHKDTLINAYRAYKKINPDTNVSSFVSDVIKAFKAVDGLSLTSPLRSVNKENVRDLQTVENKTSAYVMLTTSEDEVFNNDMRRLLSIVKDFNIIVDSSESPYLGIADSSSDTIRLYKNNIVKAARPVRTILAHEVVHIATSQALANPTNNNEKLFATNINKTYLKAKNKLGKEAGENSKEFLAEFFSNKEFREKLNSVEKGLLEQILDWIKNLLGIPTTIEELVRNYTNTFIDNFTGYDRNFAMGSDPLYQEYRDNGISLSRRETLLSSISGYIINYVQNGITDEAEIKDAVKDTLIEAKESALEEVVPILEKIVSDDTFFDIVYNDAKQYVLKLDIGFDERENWQLDSRFEVNPWMTTSKQVRKFLASIPETTLQDGELVVLSNEFALIPYKNPISLHANLAEVLAGKNVMEHLGYLAGLNNQGIVYDPVKAYIYYKLEEFRNGTKEEKQIFNAFNTDFKKYKAEFISIKHKETVATVGGQILEDENGLPQMAYSYDVYESNKTGSKTFLAQWYNSFLNRMTVDGNINKEKAEALLSRLNKADTGKNVDTAEVERILNEFGITMSPNAVELAINDPKSVDRRLNQGIIMKAIRMVITSATKVKADEEAFSINNPFIAEESNLKLLSRFEAQVNSTSFTSLFRTESGKNMYAVSNNYMLTRLEKQLKEKGEFLQNLSTDIYSKNSLLVNELNQGIDFDIKIFSEFVNLKGKPSAIKGLTSQERILVKMSAFNNRGEDTTLIQFPTLEAKPVIPFLKAKRIHVTLENGKVNDGTVDLMYNIVKSEFDRIQRVKEEQVTLPYEEQVERYHFTRKGKDIHKPSASGLLFHLTPIMNEFEIDGIKVKDMSTEQFEMYEDSIKERLKDYAKEIIDITWEDLIRADIATATNNGRSIKSKFLDSAVKNKLGKKIKQDAGSFTVEEYVANFALNYYIRQADIYQVFGGDIAYTKGHTDMAKRLAMLVAPGQDLDVAKDSLTVMAIPDRPVASPMIPNFIKVINHINEKYKDKGVSIDVEKTLESLKNINATDGQTWVGLDYKRDELDSLGRLDESTEELIELAEAGIDEAPKILPIGSSKIVYVGRVWDGKKYITLYLKTSTNTVLPGVHTPDLLEKTKRADLVAHESSIKIGMRGLSEEGVVHSVPRTGLAQQQEITYHGDDTAITALSQARRMLTEAFTDPVFKDLKYDFQGKKLGAADFRAQFQKLHIASVKEAWDRLADKLGVRLNDDEGKISYEITDLDKVRQLLLESGRLNDVEAELLEMKNGKFVIPLFFSPANERFESLLFSIISNRIISLDQNGSSFVQVSQKGFDNKNAQKIFDINELSPEILNEIKWLSDEDKANILRDNKGLRDMYFDGKKMKPAQILLPNVFKKFFVKNQDITLEDLRKSGLSEVFLMRSPYQLASGFSAEIVGFLPESAGEIIVVPNEAMIRIGFDFDVDKLYAYLYNAEFTEKGVNRIKYSTAPEEVEYRYKEYIKGRIFDIIDGNEVLEDEKEGLNNEFKETIKQIVKAKTDSVMGDSISKANDDFREALKTLPAYVIRQVKDIVYAKNTSLEQKEAGLAEYISSLKGNIQIKYSDLQKLEVEYNNFVFNVNRRKSIEQEYKNIIRETSGYDEMRKNLSNEVRNRLTDLAIESGKVPVTFAEFTSKSIEEQNSKKARENALLDQFMEVYSHPEIMYKLLTVNSEAPIAEAVDRIGRKSVKGSPLTMREQDRLFSAMKDSKTGISISSMWVTFQEALQNNKVKLKIYDYDKAGRLIPITAGVKFLNEKGKLHKDTALLNDKVAKEAEDLLPKGYEGLGMYSIKTRGISQDLVGKYLLILQTATVDNAKNQGMYPANLNDYTLPTALYLGAMGIDDFDILVRFLNQPIILEYVDLMNNGFSHNKAVKTLFGKYGKSVVGLNGKPAKTTMDRLAIKAFSSKDLLNLIQDQDRTVDYYNDQLEILNKWAVYTESAMTLGSAATKANFDTKKLGKNYFDVQNRLKGYNDILSNKTFVNLDNIFEGNVLGAYVDYGIIPASTMFNNEQLLPYHYRLYNKAYNMYSQNVFLNDGRFDDSTRRQFNKNILAFIASYANGVSDASERGALLSLPKEVSKLKEAYPDNLLLSRIDIIPGKPVGKKYDSMTFRRVGLDVSEVKYMVQSFTELLDNPETQVIAEKMIKYTFLFQGLAQSAGSLLTVIPPTYLLSTEFGSRYQSKDFQDKMNDLDMTELFFDQYAAHHPENFYPKYNKPVKGQDPTRLILTFEEAAVERGEDTIIPEYIKMDVRVGKRRFTVAAKKMSENETHVEYRALNPLGTTDFTEYSMDDYASLVNPVIVNDYTPFFRPTEIIKETVVEEVGDLPVNTMQESLNPSDYTNHSGGAYGGDTYWDIIGREFNVTNHKHYKDAGNASLSKQLRDKGVKAEILTKEQMEFARQKVKELLGITYKDDLRGNLQVRNFYQVYNAEAVYAIAKMNEDWQTVKGGTNTAVQLGIKLNKPVYVWDINTENWFEYQYDQKEDTGFMVTSTPTLTKNFAGVGSRDIENYNVQKEGKWVPREEYVGKEKEEKAKQAIRDVYIKTLSKPEENPNKVQIGTAIAESTFDKATKEKLFKELNNAQTDEELGAILKKLCNI